MATITYDDGAVKTIGTAGLSTPQPGHGRSGPPVMSGPGGRMQKVVTGVIAFDASYPAGGEDISDVFDKFAGGSCHVFLEQPIQVGAQTGKFARVDHTNRKVQLFTNASPFAEVGAASDQSLITGLRFLAIGAR